MYLTVVYSLAQFFHLEKKKEHELLKFCCELGAAVVNSCEVPELSCELLSVLLPFVPTEFQVRTQVEVFALGMLHCN